MAHHDIDVTEIAAWLVAQGPERLWTIDGEYVLAGRLSLPATATDVAELLRRHGGRIRVYDAPDAGLAEGEVLDRQTLEKVAENVDGERGLNVAWIGEDEVVSEPWMLIHDTLAEGMQVEQRGVA